jgi:hypothetical protein
VRFSARPATIGFWLAALALGALTLAPKLARAPKSTSEIAGDATEHLRRFLTPLSRAPLQHVQLKPPIEDWSGWRFTAGACQALVFPSGQGGEMTAAARLHAGPGDRVDFIYHGERLAAPPTTRIALDYMASRVMARPSPFYVVLIRPAACTAPLNLPWSKLS